MKVREMVYRFKQKAQRVDTKSAPGLKLPQIIMYLNSGMMTLLKTRYGTNNNYRQTLESIQKRVDEWQKLIVPHEKLTSNNDLSDDSIYSFDLLDTAEKYLFLLRISTAGTKGNCKEQKLNTFFSPSNNLEADLDNPNAKPNFEWREVLYRFAQDKILAYSDSTFSIDSADIDYLRYPKAVDIAGYKHFDGSDSADVDCELPDFLHEEIINQAVIDFELSEKHPGVESSMAEKQMEE